MAIRQGDTINSYRLLHDFKEDGGGNGQYSFVTKSGTEYFIKRFLRPVYPTPDSPGSNEIKQHKKKICESFEKRHRKIKEILSKKSVEGGNLVITRDFFRHKAHYYKITDKVNIAPMYPKDISLLESTHILLLLKTLSHSVKILHSTGIVHGDLKPENILIKKTISNKFVAKLIDFDDSFFSKEPPVDTEEIIGDPRFYSPELGLYIRKDPNIKPSDLSTQPDIFALGLLFHLYLTGNFPKFEASNNYPFEIIASGNGKPILDNSVSPWMRQLILEMLHADYQVRPDINSVFRQLLSEGKAPTPPTHYETNKLKGDLARSPSVEKKTTLRGKGFDNIK